MAFILFNIENQIATITLNNLDRRNALCKELIEEMIQALEDTKHQDVRVVVIRAPRGVKVWSAGHDIRELPMPGRDPLGFADPLIRLIQAIQYLPLPVIAMIEGGVWGGACDLALSCDILVGCPTSTFTMTPAKIGIPYNPSGILHFMNVLGVNRVKEMFFTARTISAEEAEHKGILNHLVPQDQLEKMTYELAGMVARNSPLSISAIKEEIRLLACASPLSPLMFERIQGLRRMVYDSQDYAEGIKAFQEKRPPVFKGE